MFSVIQDEHSFIRSHTDTTFERTIWSMQVSQAKFLKFISIVNDLPLSVFAGIESPNGVLE